MVRIFLAIAVALFTCIGPADAAEQQPAPKSEPTKTSAALKLAPGQSVVYVDNLHCAGCARKVARKIFGVKGVVRVETSVKDNRAVVTPQAKTKISGPAIWAAVQKSGFRPVKLIGPDGIYAADKKTGGPVLMPKPAKEAKEAKSGSTTTTTKTTTSTTTTR